MNFGENFLFTQGIFTAIIGATLIDLTEIAGCSYAQIGQALTGLHLAMPVGSIGGGILCGRYPDHLDLFLTVFLSSLALSSAALPWCSHLWLMASVMVVQGLSRSALTCCEYVHRCHGLYTRHLNPLMEIRDNTNVTLKKYKHFSFH